MKVIILRGLPGSGKSTHRERNFPNSIHCSADNFFNGPGGYKFDPSKLPEAHTACFKGFCMAINEKWDSEEEHVIVVDNTNITMFELAPYWRVATAYGINVEVHEILAPIDECIRRNIHNVPAHSIQRMANNWEDTPPYVTVKKFGSL